MSGIASLFEPEELFGSWWHRMVGEAGAEARYPEACVSLDDIRRRLEIFFRGVGGQAGVEIKAIPQQTVTYRQTVLARIGHGPTTAVSQARFDGDHLYLPQRLELLPEKSLNADLYKWLTAWAAVAGNDVPEKSADPLQSDIIFIRFNLTVSAKVLKRFPGMKAVHERLLPHILKSRTTRALPAQETAIESVIHHLLGAPSEKMAEDPIVQAVLGPLQDISHLIAGSGYKTFMPVALWGEISAQRPTAPGNRSAPEQSSDGQDSEQKDGPSHKAKRKNSDQIDNRNSLIINRFEAILSWAEMMNLPRAVDDEDEDQARKAADDQEELGLGKIAKKAATKLKLDLDLAPEDVEHERLSAKHTYPEWDYRKNIYHPDHCRVLANPAPTLEAGVTWQPDKAARKRIRAVKRQFEALRPRQERFLRQVDGNEIDMDALIRARCDMKANGTISNRVFSTTRQIARDLSVSVLIDVSRSSESWIEGRQVIDISKEALTALTVGLAACGDDNAIYSFSSLRRDRVIVSTIKSFDEALGPQVFSRIGALKPGFYTRLGAAIRHVNVDLANTASSKRLLLVLTDGKPNDLDHYEGRYGIEDTAMAVREARRSGTAVFGITIDKKAQSYFPYIFGRNAFAITSHANDLIRALPQMYRHLVK